MNLDEETVTKLEKQFRDFEEKVPVYDAIHEINGGLELTDLGRKFLEETEAVEKPLILSVLSCILHPSWRWEWAPLWIAPSFLLYFPFFQVIYG